MRDEIDSRIWVEGHDQFSASLDRNPRRLGARLKTGFFSAPAGYLLSAPGALAMSALVLTAAIA